MTFIEKMRQLAADRGAGAAVTFGDLVAMTEAEAHAQQSARDGSAANLDNTGPAVVTGSTASQPAAPPAGV